MIIEMSICCYNDKRFDVILRDKDTREEVTLSGKQDLNEAERDLCNRIAPPCVYTLFAKEDD